MSSATYVAAATGTALALASSWHCLVMCGPLAAATHGRGGARATSQYLAGRLVTYTLAGLLVGSAGNVLVSSSWARVAQVGLSWLLACSLLLTALGQLRTAQPPTLVKLGRRPRRSLASALLVHVADEPLLLGMSTALLPCGALFSALLAAASLGSAQAGAIAMASFGLGSGVALLAAAQLSRLRSLGLAGRRVLAGALLVGAALMVWRPLPLLQAGGQPSCHQPEAH